MSLGKYKSRSEIYSDTFTLDWEMVADNWYCWDDYYHYGWDYDSDYEYESWQYKENIYGTYVSKRVRVTIEERLIGRFIDMDSIYEMGTIYYRERMLNRLLGLEKFDEERKTKIGDYFPKDKEIKNL
jgi:hypothetical protein